MTSKSIQRSLKNGAGFTLTEVLLVIFIFIILVSFSVPVGLDFYKSQQLESVTQEIIFNLRKAQMKSMSIERDSSFGIHFENDKYFLFKGISYLDRDINYDEIFNLPKIIKINGVNEIIFSKQVGIPNVIGDIFLDAGNNNLNIININEIGRINFQ